MLLLSSCKCNELIKKHMNAIPIEWQELLAFQTSCFVAQQATLRMGAADFHSE